MIDRLAKGGMVSVTTDQEVGVLASFWGPFCNHRARQAAHRANGRPGLIPGHRTVDYRAVRRGVLHWECVAFQRKLLPYAEV